MPRYAQINLETGLVDGDSHLSGEVNEPNMIPVADDFDLTNKKYVNGEWVEYTPEPIPEPEPEPTQLDRIEETVNSIANGQNENTEAIDALLGV